MSKIDLLKINDPKGELPDSFYKYSLKQEIKYPTLSKNYKSQICIIGAGSVITKNISKNSLALSRAPQLEIKNYRKKKEFLSTQLILQEE